LTGGFNTSVCTAPCIDYKMGDRTHKFVQLDKNALWFLKSVGGPTTRKGELRAVEVLHEIREKFNKACDGVSAVAEAESAADEDLMDTLDDVASSPRDATNQSAKLAQLARNKQTQRSEVQQLVMPKRPRCTGVEQDLCNVISVYRQGAASVRNKSNLYLNVDNLDWLLSYAADELHFQGVERTEAQAQDAVANCPAVADLNVEWNFTEQTWEARFVAGPHADDSRQVGLNDLNRSRWLKLRRMGLVEGDFKLANKLLQKQGSKELAILWCKAVLHNEEDVFCADWSLWAAAASQPVRAENAGSRKKRRV
jgi:hypothetical protein